MLSSSSARSRKNAPKTGNPGVNRGIRRTPPSIETNLNSYDRTDPFQAFNVLLKLLGSISSRIGACQYRLTPQEHKLSLHLLDIVQPFVGSTPSKRTLITRQPTEVLDAIVFHIDSRVDLLNLAMTCSRMQGIVIPRHFDYRHVKCKVSSISVWHHLSVHRSLAMNVRRLEVLDERVGASSQARELVPGGISSTETDLEETDDELEMHEKQEQFLLAALGKMTHLESLIWRCNHSPISIDVLWPMLIKCHTLKEVEINDNLVFSPVFDDKENAPSLSVARELKTVALKSTAHAYGSAKHPDFTRVKGMLNSCPNLESLDIAYTQARSLPQAYLSADDLFLFGRWPNLTSLTLTNLRCSPSTGLDAASTFLFAHLNLEILHLDMSPGTPTNKLLFPPNSLPRLRELKAHRDVVSTLLTCPSDAPRPLEIIKGVRLTPEANASFFISLRRFGINVKRVELASWSEMEDIRRLVDAAPRLAWLDLGRKGYDRLGAGAGAGSASGGKNLPIQGNVNEWAVLLSAAPELTTFHGVKFFYEVSLQAQAAVSVAAASSSFGMTDRSRIRKNDETASCVGMEVCQVAEGGSLGGWRGEGYRYFERRRWER
ncbi:hypothetical protein BT96DRAFT_1014113 [Gymnopus androsaceus JB14]|uniref:F-box domain-containing protein n=1 Tax=Gymnopus androsaceus JB14 TaxID=1447944 RepID=A0A6A4IAB7_9AGAR|nr:hypothetical protein BT96DRAFT_1014113 [Gymnopus androsaceus JB14]